LGEFRDKSVGFILDFLIDQDSWFLQAEEEEHGGSALRLAFTSH
jgi:hypothetical protein